MNRKELRGARRPCCRLGRTAKSAAVVLSISLAGDLMVSRGVAALLDSGSLRHSLDIASGLTTIVYDAITHAFDATGFSLTLDVDGIAPPNDIRWNGTFAVPLSRHLIPSNTAFEGAMRL